MKVLHVIPSLSPVHGGPTHALLLMERALRARGVDVETAATDDGNVDGKVPGVPRDAHHHFFAKRVQFYKVAPAFGRWIAQHVRDYDLVHIHALFSYTSAAAARAARRAGVPYVVRPLGTLSSYSLGARRPWLKRMSIACIEGPILRHAAALHFTSEQEAVEARALGIAWWEAIIPLGVDAPAVAAGAGRFEHLRGAPTLLYLSRLDPKKNLEGLLEAMKIMRSEQPSLQLLVAGDGPRDYVQQLQALAAKLGVADRTTWAGRLDGEAKAEAFGCADVYVLPSHSENFGIAAAEALLAGLPCVLGRGVAIAAGAAEAGAALECGTDAASIAQAVQRIIASPADAQRMRERAARFGQREFSVAAMGERLVALYDDILRT